MRRGVLYIAYDNRPSVERGEPISDDFVVEMAYSVQCARRLDLPIALLLEDDTRLCLDLSIFDQVIRFDGCPFRAEGVHHFTRKYLVFELTPFDLTLYLDSDAFVVNESHPVHADWPTQPAPGLSGFDHPFDLADRHGLAMAYDGYHLGRLERDSRGQVVIPYDQLARAVSRYLPGRNYVPLFNGGVMFFRKGAPGLAALIRLANEISLAVNCDDQTGISVACELRDYPLARLYDRVWNCRNHVGPFLPWWGARILHNPTWYREIMKMGGQGHADPS